MQILGTVGTPNTGECPPEGRLDLELEAGISQNMSDMSSSKNSEAHDDAPNLDAACSWSRTTYIFAKLSPTPWSIR